MLYHGYIEYLLEQHLRRLSGSDLRSLSVKLYEYFRGKTDERMKKLYEWVFPLDNLKQNE